MHVNDLPALNAALNGLSLVLLTLGFLFIRSGRRLAHRRCMLAAFGSSCVFLVCYVLHKVLVHGVHTKIGAEGWVRTAYYVMLFSHIVLAVAIVPLALVTMVRGLRERFDAHRRVARWTWPIWMYVSVTGVLIYFMLYRWFPAAG
jgi:uncharacterized membrane protein YozB (DUF420 family)